MKNSRAKKVERAVRLIYASLESHLQYMHKKSSEGQAFHKRCVKEYAELIKLLTELI